MTRYAGGRIGAGAVIGPDGIGSATGGNAPEPQSDHCPCCGAVAAAITMAAHQLGRTEPGDWRAAPRADGLREVVGRLLPPVCGEYGGPLVQVVAHYEDGTTETVSHERVTAVRRALSAGGDET